MKRTILWALTVLPFVLTAAPVVYEPDGEALFPAPEKAHQTTQPTFKVGNIYQPYDRDQPCDITLLQNEVVLEGWQGERVHALLIAAVPEGDSFKDLLVTSTEGSLDIIRYTTSNDQFCAPKGEFKKNALHGDILDGTVHRQWKGCTRPILFTFDIPREGVKTFTGTLTAVINGTPLTLPYRISAKQQVLPPVKDWKIHLDLWQHPDTIARWHDVPLYSEEHLRLARPYMETLADMGQKVITTTIFTEAWHHQTYDDFESMIQFIKLPDGTWKYDYTHFDTWVAFMMSCGINKQISCYSLIPWNNAPYVYIDAKTGQRTSMKIRTGSEDYNVFWGAFLRDFVKHLKAKGWLEITCLACDERGDAEIKAAFKVASEAAPELRLIAACNRPTAINDLFYDVTYAYGYLSEAQKYVDQRRAAGKLTTFYTCVNPWGSCNTFLRSPLAESTYLPIMVARYNLDGYLRWAWSSWPKNPLMNQDFGNWPSSDTSLIYPGPRKALRTVMMREGIECFEKLQVLKQQGPLPKAVAEALQCFTTENAEQKGAAEKAVRQLNACL